jgi:uncharacterized protein (DUF433 family)
LGEVEPFGHRREIAGPFWQIDTRVEYCATQAHLSPVSSVVVRNPEILGGTAVFAGTRVPVKNLTDSLEGGSTIDKFLDEFPSVSREQAVAFLEEARAPDRRAMSVLLDERLAQQTGQAADRARGLHRGTGRLGGIGLRPVARAHRRQIRGLHHG